jgi:hypothetical protein
MTCNDNGFHFLTVQFGLFAQFIEKPTFQSDIFVFAGERHSPDFRFISIKTS